MATTILRNNNTTNTRNNSARGRNNVVEAEGNILTLPQSDLKRHSSDFMVTTIPLSVLRQDTAKIVVSPERSATLLTNDQSLALTMLGTSNSLVMYPPSTPTQPTPHTTSSSTSSSSSSSHYDENENDERETKKQKKTDTIVCRLVQPGGSGAAFLTGQSKAKLQPSMILPFLPRTTSELSLAMHYSAQELQDVLETMHVINGSSNKNINNNNENSNNEGGTWRALSEDDIWQAKAAVVQTLCEEMDEDNDDEDDENVESKIAERLSGGFDLKTSVAMAHQYWRLATTSNSNSNSNHKRRQVRKETVRLIEQQIVSLVFSFLIIFFFLCLYLVLDCWMGLARFVSEPNTMGLARFVVDLAITASVWE